MRILDEDNNKVVSNVSIFLTLEEAKEMADSLDELINRFGTQNADHFHLYDNEFQREITVCLYDKGNLTGFDDRSKLLIEGDK